MSSGITELSQYDRDLWTIVAMEATGGSFVKALAQAARQADDVNRALIRQTWPEYWAKYEKLGEEQRLAACCSASRG